MTSLSGSKKAQQANYVAVIIFLLVFGLSSVIAATIYLAMKTVFTNAGLYTGAIATAGEGFLAGIQMYDTIIVILMAVMIIGVGITSFRLNTRPMFFIVTVIEGVLIGFISYFFNYIFSQMVTEPTFATAVLLFPKTILLLTNLHWIALVLIVVGSITLYAKKPQGQEVIPE